MSVSDDAASGSSAHGASDDKRASGQSHILGAVAVLALALLCVLGRPQADEGLFSEPEVSPFRGEEPYRAMHSTHKYHDKYGLAGWGEYFAASLPILVFYGIAWVVWPGDHLRHLQILNVVETGGLNFGGGFGQYPQYPVPTSHHDSHSLASRVVRQLFPKVTGGFVVGWACRWRWATLDNYSLFLVLLDILPNLWGSPHVFQRPTHNLRLLLLSISTPASRSRAWSIVMGLFYVGTGLPKCFPAFYRYWLWFGIYPSSTLSMLPPALIFERGPDGGLHPNFTAQLFGFMAGVVETSLAILHLMPYSNKLLLRLRGALGVTTHMSIILGRFDNGLSGWNLSWLLQNIAHCLAPERDLSWRGISRLAKAVLAVEVAAVVLFFSGHGNYHSGMSHHTGNFRMQWLVFDGDASWDKFTAALSAMGRKEACSKEFPVCVHNWNHGAHYPTQNFEAYTYALAGGASVKEVLPAAALSAPMRRLGEGPSNGTSVPRAMFLGFSAGWSIWDDAFYARWAAESVRDAVDWNPGECLYVELDRQKPWMRTRWASVWDVSRRANGSDDAWSLLDGSFGGPVVGRLQRQWPIPVRRPFPLT